MFDRRDCERNGGHEFLASRGLPSLKLTGRKHESGMNGTARAMDMDTAGDWLFCQRIMGPVFPA